jgi:general secretion pathway protein M
MSGRLIDLLLRLSARERRLLALLALLALPAVLWLGLITPLQEARSRAFGQAAETRALGLWLVQRAGDQARLTRPESARRAPPIGISGLEQSLVAAGLRGQVSRLGGTGDGRIELGFDAVEFDALAGWLSRSEPTWGYEIAALRLQRGAAPGQVAAELVLQPPEGPGGQP